MWEVIEPKAPQGFHNFLSVTNNYVIQGKPNNAAVMPEMVGVAQGDVLSPSLFNDY